MQTDPLRHPAQTWVIEQYLQGRLPADLHQQVTERRQTDPAFEQRVLAHWMVTSYLDDEGKRAQFSRDLEQVTQDVGKKRGVYNTSRPIQYLAELLAGVTLFLMVGVWLLFQSQRPPQTRLTQTIDVEPLDPGERGFADVDEQVTVVRLRRRPGWQGWLKASNQYAWPNDTLYIYDEGIRQLPTDSLRLINLGPLNQYLLRAGTRNLRIDKGQTEPTSFN